jgi:short-subunit dehydrogenase
VNGGEEPAGFGARYGPWALVLGGSEGIGGSFAEQIAAAGVNLVLVARRPEPLDVTAAAVRAAHGVEVRTATVDLTADDMLDRLAAATEGLDVGLVVYNAGATHGVPRFLDGPVDDRLMLVRLNCVGPVRVAHHFGGRMAERGRGGMIFLTSMSAVTGAARTVTYSATKAFDMVLAEGLWAELAPAGVDVLALVAGATRTPAMASSGAHIGTEAFPGMDPDDVAREGLANLGNGPTWVAGEANRAGFDFLRTLPRADVVALMSQSVRTLYALPDDV